MTKENGLLDVIDSDWEPTPEEEHNHWNGDGDIEFFVTQNTSTCFEIEILDYSGCAGGLEETLGIEYAITNGILDVDIKSLRQGITYTLKGLNVSWIRGDWAYGEDDDVEYNFTEITSEWKLFPLIKYTLSMFIWRHMGWSIGR